jgi:thiol-disulfide isomerase/thioredoxin
MNGMGGTLLPLETMESICKLWMKDEPDNPKPYLRLSSAYKQGKVRLPEALALSEKALDLLVAGQLRLHGDIFGQMTDSLLPFAYVTAAELASDDGQYAKALAYAKAGETLGSATRPEGFTVEAQIWEALGHPSNAKTALIEAWKRGSEDAQKKLAADYPDVLRNATAAAPDSTRKNSPTFHGTTLDGKEVNFSQLKGKVIVANFWYTGCGPCKAEIPDLNRLARKFQDWDVIFLAFDVNDDEDDAALRRFLKQYPFDYTIVPHAGDTATQFGIHLFPSHVIVDRDGKIESKLEGGGANVQDLETIVARLVGKP